MRLSQEGTTSVKPRKRITSRRNNSDKQGLQNSAVGDYRDVKCMLRLSLVRCAGAIINSRIENLYFGAYDKKSGCAGSVINLFESGMFNHNVNVTGGITEDKCASILTEFLES